MLEIVILEVNEAINRGERGQAEALLKTAAEFVVARREAKRAEQQLLSLLRLNNTSRSRASSSEEYAIAEVKA